MKGKPKNAILVSVRIAHRPVLTCKLPGFIQNRIYIAMNCNLRKFWATYHLGTVFPTKQCSYQKEATYRKGKPTNFQFR